MFRGTRKSVGPWCPADGSLAPILVLVVLLVAAQPGSLFGQCATEIITNGDFEGGFTPDGDGDLVPNGWTEYETDTSATSIVTSVADNGPSGAGTTAFLASETNGGTSGDWTGIEQEDLNYDVSGASCIQLSMDIKVIYHDLCGTGKTTTNWEYPISVYLWYEDSEGTARSWQWGWYDSLGSCAPNPDHEVHGNLVVTGQDVDPNVWVASSWDLTTELIDPALITKIRVSGSGWDFEGQADNVSLTVTGGTFVPTLSEWGLIIFALLILTMATVVTVRRRRATAAA